MANAEEALVALKAQCLEGESEEAHAAHAAELEAAYAAFAEQREEESNPAEGETQMSADVVVTSVDPE